MNTNKIREALEHGRNMAIDKQIIAGKPHSIIIGVFNDALAELDKAQQALTDEEIERYAENHSIWHRGKEPSPDGKRDGCAPESIEEAFIVGAIWYRDNGYLAPAAGLTVEEAMEVMARYFFEVRQTNIGHRGSKVYDDLRARLTAAIQAKR